MCSFQRRWLFSGDQIVRGTYGGDEGVTLSSGHDVAYGFFNIEACPQEPLVILCHSNTPALTDRDGFGVRFWDCFNRYLGTESIQGAQRVTDPNFRKITIRHNMCSPSPPALD